MNSRFRGAPSGVRLAAALAAAGGIALAGPIAISEVNYFPVGDSDLEFIELVNPESTSFTLTGCRFTAGVDYTFANGVLAPGARIVVARDPAKFAARYPGVTTLGPYQKKLSNDGDTVVLTSADGGELIRLKYGVDNGWPTRAHGLGSSLEIVDPNGDPNDPTNWRNSLEYHGSPGRAGAGTQSAIVINEIMTHTDPPFEDAVEFRNNTAQPIDLGGYFLSNTETKPTKYRFPRPWVVPARGYRVVYEKDFDAASLGADAFTFNSAHGDEAVLLAADSKGTPTLWLDSVAFGATANGATLGRFPDGTGPLTTQRRQTLGTDISAAFPENFLDAFRLGGGASNAGPAVGPIVISQINYAPAAGDVEFLQIRNVAGQTVPLFDPVVPTNTWQFSSGVGFTFPTGLQLVAGEAALVVRTNPAAFRARYQIAANVQIFGPFTNALNNAGEKIALFRPDEPQGPQHPDAGFVPQILVDEVAYQATAPWPTNVVATGGYLERIDPAAFGNDPRNWRAAGLPVIPPAPVRLSIERIALTGNVKLTVPGPRNAAVRIEAQPILASTGWIFVAEAPVGAADFALELPASEVTRFFRGR